MFEELNILLSCWWCVVFLTW